VPTYALKCPTCGDQEIVARMKDAAQYMPCPLCDRPRPQVFFPPNVQEDRLRMWKGPLGNGYSHALGERMPDSRAERDRLARKKGVEFVGKAEFLAENKEAAQAVEYRRHVTEGGKRDEPAGPAPADVWQDKPDWAKTLGR
jgi:hypothetical protein